MNASKKQYIKVPLRSTVSVSEVITIHFYDMAPDYDFGRFSCYDFWELFYIDRGQAEITVGDIGRTVVQGEAIFVKPGECSTIKCDGVHSASVFIISFVSRSAAMRLFEDRTAVIRGELSAQMQRLIDESAATFRVSRYPLKELPNAPIGGHQMVRICLEMLLLSLLRCKDSTDAVGKRSIHRGKDEKLLAREVAGYLQSRVMERVTISEIVHRFNFGKSYLSETFKREYGVTMMKYHAALKIEEAKRMLREEGMTVFEVSEQLSFESPEYFSRVFKNAVGMAPTTFRRTLISGKTTALPHGRG